LLQIANKLGLSKKKGIVAMEGNMLVCGAVT
jgi:hypothetical protein